MFIRIQRSHMGLFLIAALLTGAVAVAATDSTVLVRPLIGEPWEESYCQAVLAATSEAQTSIDVLLSSAAADGTPLLSALAEAAARGVEVRALLDASDWEPDITAKNSPALSYLLDHGVAAKFDDPQITLHAKLVVVDGQTVILGSSNWNHYALTEHRQADVLVRDGSIGEFFCGYFDMLWNGEGTQRSIELDLPDGLGDRPTVIPLGDVPDCASYGRVLLALLGSARHSIHVAMYRMSYYSGYGDSLANEILQALISAAQRGLEVQVLLDDCAYYADSAEANLVSAIFLDQHGVEVRLDVPDVTTHCKLVVIDGQSVILGSTNWNYYALEQNDETDLALVCVPEVAEPFEAYFQSLWITGRKLGT